MGKYSSFICFSTTETLLCIGTFMCIISLAATGIAIAFYVGLLSGTYQFSRGALIYTYVSTTIYAGAAIQNCIICFAELCDNLSKTFNTYNGIAFLAVSCALYDAISKFSFNLSFSIFFIVYFCIGCFCLFMTCILKIEAKENQRTLFGDGFSGQIADSLPQSSGPKFSNPLSIEKAELRDVNEMKPMNTSN